MRKIVQPIRVTMAKKSIVTLFNILRVSQELPSYNHSQFLTDRNFAQLSIGVCVPK
ncbi:hypothetical protein [Sediminicola luteus]|uniref:Uncharacterized protein n=1 Tax=Sediminicola luteus TaxID=319238 RepID=A0ABV2TW56_9FLAO